MNAALPPGNGLTRTVMRSNCFTSLPENPSITFHNSAAGRPATFAALSSLAGSNTTAATNAGGTYFASTGDCPSAGVTASVATAITASVFRMETPIRRVVVRFLHQSRLTPTDAGQFLE